MSTGVPQRLRIKSAIVACIIVYIINIARLLVLYPLAVSGCSENPNLEYCEKHKAETIETNTNSVITAVEISNNLKIPLLYISTAGIFDGAQDIYDDWDKPNPLGVYARSKYIGELYVKENCKDYCLKIVRANQFATALPIIM